MAMKRIETIGVLTAGGDCPGLNAVIRAIVRTAHGKGLKVFGIRNGFKGLVENDMFEMHDRSVSGILPIGGTVLGTSNRENPLQYPVERDGQVVHEDMTDVIIGHFQQRGIQAVAIIGGDGSLNVAGQLHRKGMNVVSVPKTIDNDIPGTERTFGFDTAVQIATEALDRLHTTAASHHRIMILEVMGRTAGWIALHSGIAGGADAILLPELPYREESLVRMIRERASRGKTFSLIVISEGARPQGGEVSVARVVEGSWEKVRLGGIGEKLARRLEEQTGMEARCTVLGHIQRGGTPTAFDRVLCSRYGSAAAECLANGDTGVMVALKQNDIITIPIDYVCGKTRTVPLDDEKVFVARNLGICFGD
ncbi:MAG: 6-phosphofructokinase [Negativicutes bacterium]|nr:6-phosphofructokinase [Negativicutes bacterium]